MINTLGRLLNKVINFNEPIRLTEKKKKITVAARTGSVCHLEVILIEDLCVMSVRRQQAVCVLCAGGEEWKRGWGGGAGEGGQGGLVVPLRREEVCVVWSSIPLRPFGCKGIAALRRQR